MLLSTNVEGRARQRGELVDLTSEVATYLREAGRVEIVRQEHLDTPEDAERVEIAARRTRVRSREVVADDRHAG